jgi:hypothetical protein
MPPKRSALNSPNPVKHQLQDIDSQQDVQTHPISNVEPAVNITMPLSPPLVDVVFESAAPSSPVPVAQPAFLAAQPAPPPAVAGGGLQSLQCPVSPGHNRAKFFSAHATASTVCNLDYSRSSLGSKVLLTGILTAVYPASKNPDRRYILISDATGTVGLTVWNANVAKFSPDGIGSIVHADKLVLSQHNSKKTLTMTKESTIKCLTDPKNDLAIWWRGLASLAPVSLGDVQTLSENSIVTVAGILGFVTAESKNVGCETKTLTTLHMVDKTGSLPVRSWNAVPSILEISVEKPILLQRIRITSFAGQKVGELLEGSGTIVVTQFAGAAELAQFWVD